MDKDSVSAQGGMILSRQEIIDLSGINLIAESQRELKLFSDSTSFVKVSLSHKHEDKQVLHAIKKVLEDCGAKPYVDWMDCTMPPIINEATAKVLKKKIIDSQKFVFIATIDSLRSPWCNWEIGFGDAWKFNKKSIAIFPIKEDDGKWKNNEYLQQYPVIEYRDGTTYKKNGEQVQKGYYYVVKDKDGVNHLTPLKDWLLKDIPVHKIL